MYLTEPCLPVDRHHRSDSFSSVLSLASIAAAIFLPGFLIADSAAGILVAGMICLTGMEVMVDAVQQLTDSSDAALMRQVATQAMQVEGIRGIRNVRTRSVGSGHLVDITVLTDMKLSSSAAHGIGERLRWHVMESQSDVVDVLVRTQAVEVICPLLARSQRSINEIEGDVLRVLQSRYSDTVRQAKRITVHYVNTARVCVEVLLTFQPRLTRQEIQETAVSIKEDLLKLTDMVQVEVQLDLSEGTEGPALADTATLADTIALGDGTSLA